MLYFLRFWKVFDGQIWFSYDFERFLEPDDGFLNSRNSGVPEIPEFLELEDALFEARIDALWAISGLKVPEGRQSF